MKVLLLILTMLFFLPCHLDAQTAYKAEETAPVLAQKMEKMIRNLQFLYPQIQLYDIYKSVFQDVIGPEHMIKDSVAVKKYLDKELSLMDSTGCIPAYAEPCGADGNYVRVSLSAVRDGLITEEELLDAFMSSARQKHANDIELLKEQWNAIKEAVKRTPLYDARKQEAQENFIDSILHTDDVSIHHSLVYSQEYSPHYRIIAREIYSKYLNPQIYGDDSTDVYSTFRVDTVPQYPGGATSLKRDLDEYFGPMETTRQKSGETWTTYVGAIVEKDGRLSHTEVVGMHDKDFDSHALRAVRHLKKYIPAVKGGVAVRCKIIIPVHSPRIITNHSKI